MTKTLGQKIAEAEKMLTQKLESLNADVLINWPASPAGQDVRQNQ